MDSVAGSSQAVVAQSASLSPGTSTLGNLPSRSSRACFACSKRKTKCDHAIPCSACIKRGQAQACTAPEKRKRGIDPAQELDERRTAALSEIELFRNTLDTLRARLPNLEHFIATAAAPGGDGAEFDEIIRGFGNPGDSNGGAGYAESERGGRDDDGGERKRVKMGDREQFEREETSGTDPDDSAAVEAAVDLEFMTLGRSRTFPMSNDRSLDADIADESFLKDSHSAIISASTFPPSPITLYPDAASLLRASPTLAQEDVILRQGMETFGWHHRVFHAPSLYAQIAAFWDLGETRFDQASSAWVALYFAILSVGTKLLGSQEQELLSWSEEETAVLGSRWFDCCIASLYRHNFLENHDIHALQAIALIALSGRDAGSPSLIANLLSSGLSIAQDLGLHRMPSDAEFHAACIVGKPPGARAKALIDREVRKRVLWALAHTDWFSIPFRRNWILSTAQMTTPLPLNIHDEDLGRGDMVDRPASEFTVVSWLLKYVEIGHLMQSAFVQSQTPAESAYQAFLKIDDHIGSIVSNPPAWLSPTSAISKMPYFEYMRSTFLIAVQHKLLSIHRPYMHKPYKGAVVDYSRRRVVAAARAILREASHACDGRIWTFLYHISAAAFIIMLELFARAKHGTSEEWEAMRTEIREALPTLEKLVVASPIAVRGLALVQPLLAQEQRLKEEAAMLLPSSSSEPNRRHSLLNPSIADSDAPHPLPPISPSQNSLPSQSGPTIRPSHAFHRQSAPYLTNPASELPSPLPFSPFPHPGGTPVPGNDFLQNPTWFYDLGENSEEWLHMQLSGPGAQGVGGFDGWGVMASLPDHGGS